MLTTTLIAIILVYLVFKLYRHFTYWKRQGIPALPYVSFWWAFMPAKESQEYISQNFGKFFGGYKFFTNFLIVNDARIVRDISIKEMAKFPIRNSFHAGSSNINKSLFFMEANEDWKRIRSIVTPAFTSGKLRAMMSPIERITGNFIDHLRVMARSGEEFDMKKYIGGFTMDVIASCGYGIELDSVSEPNHPVVVNAKKILNADMSLSLLACIFLPTVAKLLSLEAFDKKAVDYFDQLTFRIVEQRLASSGGKQNSDLLGMMIENVQAESNGHKNGVHTNGNSNGTTHAQKQLKGLTKDEMSGQGILFFIAGFDTTHATFDHVIYYLSQYPEWQDKLYQELVQHRDELEYENYKQLPVLNAIINETLRMNPPLCEFHRESKEDCEILDTGIKVPANTLIIVQPYAIHRNPEYFPDPNSFKPERFLDKSAALESNFAYMPFGVGQRLCVGMRFAQNELRIGVAHLVLNYKLESRKGMELEYFNGSILMSPKRLMVRISERT